MRIGKPYYLWIVAAGLIAFARLHTGLYSAVFVEGPLYFQYPKDDVDEEAVKHRHNTPPNTTTTNLDHATDANAIEAVTPLWKCSDAPESRKMQKFVFVHVFKTAGSSIRQLLRDYSRACHVGSATIISCTGVDPSSMLQTKDWEHCVLKDAVDRQGSFHDYGRAGKVNNNMLQNDLDIVGGHLRLGSADHLKSSDGTPLEDIRYLSFFRNAATKYVSARVYVKMKSHQRMSKEELLAHIKKEVNNQVSKGRYYSRYSSYLLTPLQDQEQRRRKIPIQNVTKLIMQNLLDYNVICGMVEHMPESMEIMHHVLDGGSDAHNNVSAIFSEMGSSATQKKLNPSPVPASVVLAELQKDEEFYQRLLEYVKYEQMITDFAMELHMRQYEAIQR